MASNSFFPPTDYRRELEVVLLDQQGWKAHPGHLFTGVQLRGRLDIATFPWPTAAGLVVVAVEHVLAGVRVPMQGDEFVQVGRGNHQPIPWSMQKQWASDIQEWLSERWAAVAGEAETTLPEGWLWGGDTPDLNTALDKMRMSQLCTFGSNGYLKKTQLLVAISADRHLVQSPYGKGWFCHDRPDVAGKSSAFYYPTPRAALAAEDTP